MVKSPFGHCILVVANWNQRYLGLFLPVCLVNGGLGRFLFMLFIGFCSASRAPRNAASNRSAASFLVKSMSFRRFIRGIKLFFYGQWGGIKAVFRPFKSLEEITKNTQRRIEELSELQKISETETLYWTVGRALTVWATMEEAIVIVISLLLRVPPNKAGVVMYSIHSFGPWVQIPNDLFDLDETLKPFKKRFNQIYEGIRALKDQRDQLAHHSVKGSVDSAFVQASHMDLRTKSKKQRPLSVSEVLAFTHDILDATNKLKDLIEAMQDALKSSLQKPGTQASDQAGPPGSQ